MNDMSEQTGRGGPRLTAEQKVAPRWLVQALHRRLRRAARRLGIAPGEQVGIAVHFVDDAAIARLNAQHMGKAGPTDVLSFPAGEAPEGAPGIGLGDVVISVDAVRRQARARLGLPAPDAGTGAKRQVLWGVVVETGRKGQVLPDMVEGTAEAAAAIDEATVLAVHGLCHLLGHDHGQAGEARRMLRSERRALAAARTPDVPRPYARGSRRTG